MLALKVFFQKAHVTNASKESMINPTHDVFLHLELVPERNQTAYEKVTII